MSEELWSAVDAYLGQLLLQPDAVLAAALAAGAAAGLPSISVSPPQGKLLTLLAELTGAGDILEIGILEAIVLSVLREVLRLTVR